MVNEEINSDDQAVTALLAALPRVDAPADFDFRVKARIASGAVSVRPSGWLTPARVAVPVVLFLAVGGYVALSSFAPTDAGPASASVSSSGNIVTPVMPPPPPTTDSLETEVAAEKRETRVSPAGPRSEGLPPGSITFSANGSRTGGGGSIDSGSKASRRIYAKGLDPNVRQVTRPRDFDIPATISAKDVMSAFGAEVVYSASGWKVESVKQNSSAERAGVKSGDFVEAINEQKLDGKTSFRGKFSGKSVRLKRGSENVEIDLRKP